VFGGANSTFSVDAAFFVLFDPDWVLREQNGSSRYPRPSSVEVIHSAASPFSTTGDEALDPDRMRRRRDSKSFGNRSSAIRSKWSPWTVLDYYRLGEQNRGGGIYREKCGADNFRRMRRIAGAEHD
jgi:hypothetical protein